MTTTIGREMAITLRDARGAERHALVSLRHVEGGGDDESGRSADPSYGEILVRLDGRRFAVGGYIEFTASMAREANDSKGLQPDAHPDIQWPGAVDAGDRQWLDIGPRKGDIGVWPSDWEQSGQIEELVKHLGYVLEIDEADDEAGPGAVDEIERTYAAWQQIAAGIMGAAYVLE